jgi:hypothetical protein
MRKLILSVAVILTAVFVAAQPMVTTKWVHAKINIYQFASDDKDELTIIGDVNNLEIGWGFGKKDEGSNMFVLAATMQEPEKHQYNIEIESQKEPAGEEDHLFSGHIERALEDGGTDGRVTQVNEYPGGSISDEVIVTLYLDIHVVELTIASLESDVWDIYVFYDPLFSKGFEDKYK